MPQRGGGGGGKAASALGCGIDVCRPPTRNARVPIRNGNRLSTAADSPARALPGAVNHNSTTRQERHERQDAPLQTNRILTPPPPPGVVGQLWAMTAVGQAQPEPNADTAT